MGPANSGLPPISQPQLAPPIHPPLSKARPHLQPPARPQVLRSDQLVTVDKTGGPRPRRDLRKPGPTRGGRCWHRRRGHRLVPQRALLAGLAEAVRAGDAE